jgi:hypothetical protein
LSTARLVEQTNCRRNFVPGGSYFFTVNLAERNGPEKSKGLMPTYIFVGCIRLPISGVPLAANRAGTICKPVLDFRLHFVLAG